MKIRINKDTVKLSTKVRALSKKVMITKDEKMLRLLLKEKNGVTFQYAKHHGIGNARSAVHRLRVAGFDIETQRSHNIYWYELAE